MCVIAVCRERKLTKAEFSDCWTGNSDGAGFGWPDGDAAYWAKGFMEEKSAWKFYRENVDVIPHVVHFRAASCGKVDKESTHPFPVELIPRVDKEGYAEKILFHNGVVPEWESLLLNLAITLKENGEPWSAWTDTRVIASIVSIAGEDILDVAPGKWVIVTPTDIRTYGRFEKKDDILYSSSPWKFYLKESKGYYLYGGWDEL